MIRIHRYSGTACTVRNDLNNFRQPVSLSSRKRIIETMESDERGMSPVKIAIINPLEENWPSRGSNQRTSVLNSCILPTELCVCGLNREGGL